MAHLELSSFWVKAMVRIFHELSPATVDMAVLPGVLGPRTLRRTVQVRLGSEPLRIGRWHIHLHALATAIHEICGLAFHHSPLRIVKPQ